MASAEYNREYFQKNKERLNARRRARYAENSEKVLEQGRKYRERNRKLCNARAKDYRERNPEVYREWKNKNPDYEKTWRENNRESRKMTEARRRARKLGLAYEKFTDVDVLSKWGDNCHICGAVVDLDAPRRCGWKGWELGLHLDHVIPLSGGGTHTLENVKPAHGICNTRKSWKIG